uniref:Transmembrane protein n=1 Tax=Globodera pallida TaxID=36090 RepID=A0A183BLL7_GLOPA
MVESADSVLDEAAVLPPVVGSCIEPSNLALAIFGAIFGTLLLCTAFALLIWYLMRTDKFQIADKLLVLERGLLRKRGDGGKEEGEAATATKRTDGRGVAEGTKRETETAAVGHQMDGMTTELKKGCRQLEMNIGVGGVKKEGRKSDKTEEKRAEEEEEKEEAKTEEEEEPKKKQRTKVEGRGGREEEEEAKNARGAAVPEEEKPTENAVDEPQPTNGHRFRQGCGGQPVEQNNYSKREEGRPADDEAEEGQKHSARLMTMLSAEQFGTLELNRRRLETERRQLREMGVI